MSDSALYWLEMRDKPGFLYRMMGEFACGGRMSLEGDLSKCVFEDDLVISCEERWGL